MQTRVCRYNIVGVVCFIRDSYANLGQYNAQVSSALDNEEIVDSRFRPRFNVAPGESL